jgi:5-methyltetrahydrofolate--homocysteine methyltransferase
MNERGVNAPLILGGAALARHYAEGYLRGKYEGTLLYGKDAFDGLRIMDHIASGKVDSLNAEIAERQNKRPPPASQRAWSPRSGRRLASAEGHAGCRAHRRRRNVRSDVAPRCRGPRRAVLGQQGRRGPQARRHLPLHQPRRPLPRAVAAPKGKRDKAEYEAELEDTAEPLLEKLKARCRDEDILRPAVVYGYYPVCSEGDDLVVFDAEDHDREIERFTFPRQEGKNRRLCIADFFRDADECRELGRKDVLGLSCVTMGQRVSEVCQELFEGDDYAQYLYMHGMGVETAEALAELWHKRMRQELGIGDEEPQDQRPVRTEVPRQPLQLRLPRLPRDERPGQALAPHRARAGSGASSPRTGRSIPSSPPARSWCTTRRRSTSTRAMIRCRCPPASRTATNGSDRPNPAERVGNSTRRPSTESSGAPEGAPVAAPSDGAAGSAALVA